jgi:Tol biopolymer transport system component
MNVSTVLRGAALSLAVLASSGAVYAAAGDFGPWSPALRVESLPGTHPDFNGPALDGCPFISPDGKSFYMASTRPGGLGGIDIWVSMRAGADDPWGAPINVGAPVNSPQNDFCPTMSRDGHTFYFVSNRPGGCGGDDIYTSRLRSHGWDPVENLGCNLNSAANEASPFPITERASGPVLYFSSTRSGNSDLYVSPERRRPFEPPTPISELNTEAQDGHPNLRRDGLEIFFFSTRTGTFGAQDIYSATRESTFSPWSTPVNLGPNVNSSFAETRPSLSWEGTELYFGSTRPGGDGDSDHYATTRVRGG